MRIRIDRFNSQVCWRMSFGISIGKMDLSFNYQKWICSFTLSITTYNRCSSLSIAWLYFLTPTTSFSTSNNHTRIYNSHYKACFVEVEEIVVLNAIISPHIRYQSKLPFNKLEVFAENSLEVVNATKTHL